MKAIKNKLKPEWELFCHYYVGSYETFGNAVKSYAKAYNIDITNKSKYASCRTQGYRLLTNDDVIARINELLLELVMNDTTVDSELGFLIIQREDYKAKMAAIKEYNALKQRITNRLKIEGDPVKEILEGFGLNAREVEGDTQTPSPDNS